MDDCCNGFLKYTVIYYYLDNENCHNDDECIDPYYDNHFIFIIAQL